MLWSSFFWYPEKFRIIFTIAAVQYLCVILLFQMNKAGVLRKAIEVILKLQNDNARLKQENMALKMAQQKRGMGVIAL